MQGQKKTQVLKFKVHQTCTGTKKTKVLNFKVHQTCTGTKKTKKTKTFQSTWEGASIPLKVFFCPCAGLVHFEVQDFCFFCPCAGLVRFEVQNLFFLSLCRFGAAHLLQHFYLIRAFNKQLNFLLQLAKPKSPHMARLQA